MTTEDDFQAALDAHPDDWQTRLVFADWLQERDDPRAEGYRALGVLRVRPYHGRTTHGRTTAGRYWAFAPQAGRVILKPGDKESHPVPEAHVLPSCWLRAFRPRGGWIETDYDCGPGRRHLEDAAALAFAKLPAERRAELLAAQ